MRFAIYYTPAQPDPLTRAASRWLGRDAFTGEMMAPPTLDGLTSQELAFHTAAPRRYGFHATLKAPFRLADGTNQVDLDRAVAKLAADMEPVNLPRLVLAELDGFLALVPGELAPPLQHLAAQVVRMLDPLRAPLTDAELERRNPDALRPDEFRNLCQWGYPYVFEAFRFHMTLTGRLDAAERARLRGAIGDVFGPLIGAPLAVDALAVFVEPEPGAPFLVHSRHALGREPSRMSA